MVQLLTQNNMPDNMTVFDVVDSTMIKGREMLHAGMARPFAVVANQQTAGYGKFGRQFFSPRGSGVYMTFVFDVPAGEFDAGLLTTGVAATIARVIFEVTGIQVALKWVNDLYYHDRKIAGILAEGVMTAGQLTQVSIGVGLNILATVVPSELRHKIGALDVDVDKNAFVRQIFTALQADFAGYQQGAHLDYFQAHAYLTDRHVSAHVGKTVIQGKVAGVGSHGELLLVDDAGVSHALFSGEVAKINL
ncbi:biotin--[acetyl-CoA-carboxylase] ligase [Leuconostoc holzapfelii]|uniref:Biotin--[acetyl-CoA-carboxylase] ligase n=1 Tax=Leuconostoc holzapfelii TaxID=434464 RepID=A0A846ZGM9_9LACO|nr:biotin--[acetyl-CoA-carboxylase] ligase [Leuconostoc holzapfelii]NKZ18425.1 biotin--[acetyl-CoA-carboxylase] ligase [Leuconostoc holzapfelii]